MTLKRCREQWERWYGKSKVVLEVVDSEEDYKTVIVVVKFVSENPHIITYNTLRYFTVGGEWQCSKDYEGNDLEDALKEVMDHFRDNYSDLLLTS